MELYRYLFYGLTGSLLFLGLSPFQRLSTPILQRLVLRKSQLGILSHFIEYNLWRYAAVLLTSFYFLASNEMFSVKQNSEKVDLEVEILE